MNYVLFFSKINTEHCEFSTSESVKILTKDLKKGKIKALNKVIISKWNFHLIEKEDFFPY